MVQEYILISADYESEATKARAPCAIKRFASDGKNIPLKNNWSEICCTLSTHSETIINELLNLELRDDDVILVTFMKSGTTWMQECAWLMLNNLNFEKAKQSNVMTRSPYLDSRVLRSSSPSPLVKCNLVPSPRLLKTHMPANLVPIEIWQKKTKTIYIARNVKDVIVSSYHFLKNINLWKGNNISEYVEDFINSDVIYTNYWTHVINFWLMRQEPFIFFVTYEEMKHDLADVLQRLCTFLERPQLKEEELKEIVEFLSFNSMKENSNNSLCDSIKKKFPEVKEDLQFMRRGIVGSFKDELAPELIAKIDKWTSDFLQKYGLKEDDIFGKL